MHSPSFTDSYLRRGFPANLSAIALLALLVLPGCGEAGYGHVTGTVTLNGKPVEGVNIRFAPEEGRAAWGVTKADGSYELNYTPGVMGAKTGPNTVTISTAGEPTVNDRGQRVPGAPERFPPEYNTNATHTVEVKPGENVFDFPVKTGA